MAAMNSKLCQIQNQSAESCQGTQFRTERKNIFFVIVTSSESLYWTDYCYFYILPVDNSLLGVLETKNTNTESGKLYQ